MITDVENLLFYSGRHRVCMIQPIREGLNTSLDSSVWAYISFWGTLHSNNSQLM